MGDFCAADLIRSAQLSAANCRLWDRHEQASIVPHSACPPTCLSAALALQLLLSNAASRGICSRPLGLYAGDGIEIRLLGQVAGQDAVRAFTENRDGGEVCLESIVGNHCLRTGVT